jgi:hypothetical protein
MSYTLIPYFVDVAKLSSTIGSKDESVAKAVVAVASLECDEDDDEDQIDDELEEAIFQLVTGEEKYPVGADQFGYALEEICEYCGKRPPIQYWDAVHWSAVEGCGLDDLLTNTGPPVQLPLSDDFPKIGHLRRENIAAHLQAARSRSETNRDQGVSELLGEYISWLETAARMKSDIVFFYH